MKRTRATFQSKGIQPPIISPRASKQNNEIACSHFDIDALKTLSVEG